MILMEFLFAPLLAVALRDDERLVAEDVAARDVVHDAHHEVVERLRLEHVVVDLLAHLRREVLRADAVAAGEDLGIREGDDAVLLGLADRGADVEVERVVRAGLLRAVEHRDALDRRRDGGDEVLHRERTVEVHLDEADLLALLEERVDRLVQRVAAGAHRDRDVLGVGRAHVVAGAAS